MTTQAALWTLAGALLGLTIVATLAEYGRSKRRNLDSPGWVPWTLIQVIAGIGAVAAAAVALKL